MHGESLTRVPTSTGSILALSDAPSKTHEPNRSAQPRVVVIPLLTRRSVLNGEDNGDPRLEARLHFCLTLQADLFDRMIGGPKNVLRSSSSETIWNRIREKPDNIFCLSRALFIFTTAVFESLREPKLVR